MDKTLMYKGLIAGNCSLVHSRSYRNCEININETIGGVRSMKTKKDIAAMLSRFTQIASYDEKLEKYYLVFSDKKRKGIYTLMLKEKQWSIHGRGLGYCDENETFLEEKELLQFLWLHRAAFRQSVLTLQETGS